MTVPRLFVLLLAVALAACASTHRPAGPGRFVHREVLVDGETHRYQVFVPSRDVAPRRPAVVLFLHGSGERGDDGQRQVDVGLGPHLRANAATFPALAVFPQARASSEWSDQLDVATAALDAAMAEFGGDPDRVYLTGLSMGGYGAWELGLREPRRFAALVPVCAGVTAPAHRPTLRVVAVEGEPDPFAAVAHGVEAIPTWIFHGADDPLVPAEQSRRMQAALQAAGAEEVRYTEFPGVGHASWDPAYAHAPLWDWLFAQRRD
jgi:predicted peptidase